MCFQTNLEHPSFVKQDASILVPTKRKTPLQQIVITLLPEKIFCDPCLMINLYSNFSTECATLNPNHNPQKIKECFLKALAMLKSDLISTAHNNAPITNSAAESKLQTEKLWSEIEVVTEIIKLAFALGELNALSAQTNTTDSAAIQTIKTKYEQALATITLNPTTDESVQEALLSAILSFQCELLECSYQEFLNITDVNSAQNRTKIDTKVKDIHDRRGAVVRRGKALQTQIKQLKDIISDTEKSIHKMQKSDSMQEQSLSFALRDLEDSLKQQQLQLKQLETKLQSVEIAIQDIASEYAAMNTAMDSITVRRQTCKTIYEAMKQEEITIKTSAIRNSQQEKQGLTQTIIQAIKDIQQTQQDCIQTIDDCTKIQP